MRRTGRHNYFVQIYEATVELPIDAFTRQVKEVDELRWFSGKDLREELKRHPEDFLPIIHERMQRKNSSQRER
jgi:hypothetical protein